MVLTFCWSFLKNLLLIYVVYLLKCFVCFLFSLYMDRERRIGWNTCARKFSWLLLTTYYLIALISSVVDISRFHDTGIWIFNLYLCMKGLCFLAIDLCLDEVNCLFLSFCHCTIEFLGSNLFETITTICSFKSCRNTRFCGTLTEIYVHMLLSQTNSSLFIHFLLFFFFP